MTSTKHQVTQSLHEVWWRIEATRAGEEDWNVVDAKTYTEQGAKDELCRILKRVVAMKDSGENVLETAYYGDFEFRVVRVVQTTVVEVW